MNVLIINNETVSQLLAMEDCIRVQEEAFRKLLTSGAVYRPRIDHYFHDRAGASPTAGMGNSIATISSGVAAGAPSRSLTDADQALPGQRQPPAGPRFRLAFNGLATRPLPQFVKK
jgi:hypothetical protein